MNPDGLLKHFDEISEAPDAVPRLRRFILDLAVRGKLVPQDQNDEPASALLKRTELEKAQLVKIGQTTMEKRLAPITMTSAILVIRALSAKKRGRVRRGRSR